jgi:hypothetical protein
MRHGDVLRAVRGAMEKLGPEINGRNFAPAEYTDAKGEKHPLIRFSQDVILNVCTAIGGPVGPETARRSSVGPPLRAHHRPRHEGLRPKSNPGSPHAKRPEHGESGATRATRGRVMFARTAQPSEARFVHHYLGIWLTARRLTKNQSSSAMVARTMHALGGSGHGNSSFILTRSLRTRGDCGDG